MNLEIDFTPEFANSRFAPLAVLLALYQDKKLLEPLQQVLIPMRNRYFEPAEKLPQILISILAGCETLSEVTTTLKQEKSLTSVLGSNHFADHSSLARIDRFVSDTSAKIDQYIEKNHLVAEPATTTRPLDDGYKAEVIEELDLHAAGVRSIIWATGYRYDYSLVRFPVFDEDGYPIQSRSVTAVPGLYFAGLHFMYKRKSGLPWGIAADAAYIAEQIEAKGRL